MISNSNLGVVNEEKKEELINYALICFLRVPEMEVSLENFKVFVHMYFISVCNGFGIADDQLLRIGTGLYFPGVSETFSSLSCVELSESLLRPQLHRPLPGYTPVHRGLPGHPAW